MPAFWVLRNGESVTAVTVHDLAAKLDDAPEFFKKKDEEKKPKSKSKD
jgi:methionyl-tRNA formyltransferase